MRGSAEQLRRVPERRYLSARDCAGSCELRDPARCGDATRRDAMPSGAAAVAAVDQLIAITCHARARPDLSLPRARILTYRSAAFNERIPQSVVTRREISVDMRDQDGSASIASRRALASIMITHVMTRIKYRP